MANKRSLALHTFWVLLIVIYWVKAYISLDPDLGWRLTTGNKIIHSGIPKTDVYSYTMPSFPWVDHAWFNDVVSSFLYLHFGYLGLAFVFSLLTTASIYISYGISRPLLKSLTGKKIEIAEAKLQQIALPLLILAGAAFMRFSGIRAQTWTWVFWSGLMGFVLNDNMWVRFRIYLPFVFLLWANFHGGFVAGILLLAMSMFTRFVQKQKINLGDFVILVSCVLVTLVNPYGFGVYREVWSSVADKDLRSRVVEWNSFFGSFSLAPMVIMVLSGILVFKYRSKFGLLIVTIFCILLYEGLSVVRQTPLFVLFAIPTGVAGVFLFLTEISSKRGALKRFEAVYKYFLLFSVAILVIDVIVSTRAAYMLNEKKFYPTSAVNYLTQNLSSGNIFSDYGWGGYLIWKLPDKRVFIDGRMASWNSPGITERESQNAMDDYMGIIEGSVNYVEVFDKYEIDTVLWPKNPQKGLFDTIETKYFNQLDPVYRLLGKKHSNFNFSDKLQSDGWKVVYSNQVSVIYQR